MKKFVYVSGAAVLAATLLGTPAFAAGGAALDVTLGTGITGLLDTYKDGSFSNMAVNNAAIDGSVTGTASQAIQNTSSTAASDGTGAASASTTQTTTVLNQSVGDVKASAIGAVNQGTIELSGTSVATSATGGTVDSGSTANANASGATATANFSSVDSTLNGISEGIPNVVATNFAFNNGDINAAVSLTGLGATGIATTALGAANIGTIQVGQ